MLNLASPGTELYSSSHLVLITSALSKTTISRGKRQQNGFLTPGIDVFSIDLGRFAGKVLTAPVVPCFSGVGRRSSFRSQSIQQVLSYALCLRRRHYGKCVIGDVLWSWRSTVLDVSFMEVASWDKHGANHCCFHHLRTLIGCSLNDGSIRFVSDQDFSSAFFFKKKCFAFGRVWSIDWWVTLLLFVFSCLSSRWL